MVVVKATSTNGKYQTFSGTNSTLATALSDVLNQLDIENKSSTKTDFVLTSDGTNFTFVAICKN